MVFREMNEVKTTEKSIITTSFAGQVQAYMKSCFEQTKDVLELGDELRLFLGEEFAVSRSNHYQRWECWNVTNNECDSDNCFTVPYPGA